jgi:hypothetical protein
MPLCLGNIDKSLHKWSHLEKRRLHSISTCTPAFSKDLFPKTRGRQRDRCRDTKKFHSVSINLAIIRVTSSWTPDHYQSIYFIAIDLFVGIINKMYNCGSALKSLLFLMEISNKCLESMLEHQERTM